MSEQPTPREQLRRTDAEVEQASEESFPASDPPTYNRGTQAKEGLDPATPKTTLDQERDAREDDQ